jgi:hypothetical protein
MTWTYKQISGAILWNSELMGVGYSGIDDGLDNPSKQDVANVGPIPVGTYDIGPGFQHPSCGPLSMRLTPQPDTKTFGRAGFLIHGDNTAMDHTASHGCIILARSIRQAINESDDKTLVVVED